MNFLYISVVSFLLMTLVVADNQPLWREVGQSCPSDANIDENLLSSRVDDSDVVLTGTVVRLIERQEKDGDPYSARKVSGVIRIWRVVKGNLKGISNVTGDEEIHLDEMEDEKGGAFMHAMDADEKNYPFVKIYGLWNDKMCGSFITQGETRVFFLKKLEDMRDSLMEDIAQAKKFLPKKKSKKSSPKKSGKSKKEKKKTKKDRQKSKKKKLRRGLGKKTNKKMKKMSQKKKRAAVETSKKSVLVVNAQPAKINLVNLNAIESFSKL